MTAVCFVLLGILVELAGISLSRSHRWYVRRIDVLPEKSIPGDFGKPGMVLDIIRSSVKITQSFCQIRSDELGKEVDGIWVHIRRVLDLASKNILIDFNRRPAVPKRSKPTEHLEYEDTQ